MTTNIEDKSGDWRPRVASLVLSGFQLSGHEREVYRRDYLDILSDGDLMMLGRAVNDLWNVRGLRSAYLKNAVAAKRMPDAVHTLNILFSPFRGSESPITVIMSLRGLSHYGILSEDGYEIVDHSRVGEALALMRVVQELNHVDDHDFWVGRSRESGLFIKDSRLLELIQSKRFPIYRIVDIMSSRRTGNVSLLLPVLEHESPSISVGVL